MRLGRGVLFESQNGTVIFIILSPYRFSGGIVLIMAENQAGAAGSTSRCFTLAPAGSFPGTLSPFQFIEGLIGRITYPPPQFGQTFPLTLSSQAMQKVYTLGTDAHLKRGSRQRSVSVLTDRPEFKLGVLDVKLPTTGNQWFLKPFSDLRGEESMPGEPTSRALAMLRSPGSTASLLPGPS